MRRSLCAIALHGLAVVCPLAAQEPETPAEPQTEAAPTARPEARRPGGPPARPAPPPVAAMRSDMVRDFAWRNIGPANPMGRITDIEVPRQDRSTWYIGTAGGGVWKTGNAGTTWTNVFDKVGNVSIGDVAVAPGNPDIVWVGTGEENARNSVQWGNGVFKSTDGGATFVPMGLERTFQIGHIAIHPTNPDIVFVAALGRLWGDNPERGVFRTRDGGRTWERVLYLDAHTGCIEVRIDPQQPNTVYACMYERRRDIFDGNDPAVRFGKAAGLYKSDDGGQNWRQLTNGLPTCAWGRSGIDILGKDPRTLFLVVETERSGWATGDHKDSQPGDPEPPRANRPAQPGPPPAARLGLEGEDGKPDAPGAVLGEIGEFGFAARAGFQTGDRITKVGDKEIKTFAELTAALTAGGSESLKVTYVRDGKTATLDVAVPQGFAGRGGRGGPNGPYGARLNGQVANVQDYQGEHGFECGGIFRSDDRGETWKRINSLTERPFYYSVIRVDPRDDQNVYAVGTTLWGSFDAGKKFDGINRGIHVDFHAFWVDPADSDHLLAGCDGGVNETYDRGRTWQVVTGFCAAQYYDVVADNSVPYNVIGGLQDNGTWVGPSRTRYREGITTDDWVTIYGGDGFGAQSDPLEPWVLFATSQNGALGLVDLRTGGQARIQRERPPDGRAAFNWDAPFALSPHNRLVLWSGGTYLYRSDRYAYLDNRQNRSDQGPIGNQDSMTAAIVSPRLGRTEGGTATAIAESPRVRSLLYVGTDDGALWRSQDDCHDWQRIEQNLPAMPGPRYVSDIVPSHHRDDRVYVTLDGHRFDDFRTYVFVSEDRGRTWRSLALDLPVEEPCYAIMEDPRQENLLFLGTEYGCWVSLDRGDHWLPFGRELPVVAVRDLFLHDRDGDLIAATHGRGVWICDIAPLREFTGQVAEKPAHLFRPEDAILWRMQSRGYSGNREYRAPNPPYGATVYVWFAATPPAGTAVTIHDVTGEQVAELPVAVHSGLQALQWDCRRGNRLAAPGSYAAKLRFQDQTQAQAFTLHPDPMLGAADAAPAQPTQDRGQE